MRVLIIASGNADYISPFILDQVEALNNHAVITEFFLVKGKGVSGYLGNYYALKNCVKKFNPDIIHAHYGLSGLLANLQRKIPVITTFHGSDVNVLKNRMFSKIANLLDSRSIFVSNDLANKLKVKDPHIIPCGIDLKIFTPMDKLECRKKMNLDLNKKYVLFSSSFQNKVKNYSLAKKAIDILDYLDVEMIELKGYSRQEVALLMNSVDAVLMTSFTEGSPQFIKEAMACNSPVVSLDVGDVKQIIGNTKGCYIVQNNEENISKRLLEIFANGLRTEGRKEIGHLDNDQVSERIITMYKSIRNN